MKAVLQRLPNQLIEVLIDGYSVGFVDWKREPTFWPEHAPLELVAFGPVCAEPVTGARWILEQIPGCAGLEVEWRG